MKNSLFVIIFILGSGFAEASLEINNSGNATYTWSESDSKKLYDFFDLNRKQEDKNGSPSSFWVEDVEQRLLANNLVCGKKLVKQFKQLTFGSAIFICKSGSGSIIGDRAKEAFEKGSPLYKTLTIHGSNLGCTLTENLVSKSSSYTCSQLIFSNGTSETNAPFVSF